MPLSTRALKDRMRAPCGLAYRYTSKTEPCRRAMFGRIPCPRGNPMLGTVVARSSTGACRKGNGVLGLTACKRSRVMRGREERMITAMFRDRTQANCVYTWLRDRGYTSD